MSHGSPRGFSYLLLLGMIILPNGCKFSPSSSSSNLVTYNDAMSVSYKGTEYTSFLGFLTAFMNQQYAYDWYDATNKPGTFTGFSAKEDIILNGNSIFDQHTFISSIEDPYNPSLTVPFYERYQSLYPLYTSGDFYYFKVGGKEEIISINNLDFYKLWAFEFYSNADGSGNLKSSYAGENVWYNSLIENIATSIANPTIINPENAPLLSNFHLISQNGDSFTASLDIKSWRLGYFEYNFTAALLADQNDFTSTTTITFAYDSTQDKVTITFTPGTQFYLPFLDQYLPSAADVVGITLEYQMGTPSVSNFDNVRTITSDQMTPLLHDAWIEWGGLGTFFR